MYTLHLDEFALLPNKQYMFTSHKAYDDVMIVIFKTNQSQDHLVDSLPFKCQRAQCLVSIQDFNNPMFALHLDQKQRQEEFPGMDDTIRMHVFVRGMPYCPVKYTKTVVEDVNKWLSLIITK